MKSARGVVLRRYDVSEAVFDDILQAMKSRIVIVGNIKDYFVGYKDKKLVLYDNQEYLIITEALLAYFADFTDNDYQDIEDWRQVIVRKCHQPEARYLRSIDGSRAYKHTKQALLKYYSEQDFDKRLKMFESDFDLSNIQYHYQYPSKDCVLAHSNCVKYDINGAHCDALIEIFPKAKDMLQDMYDRRKQDPLLKAYINYFVGMLCRKGYRRTYNWIVQRTSRILKKAIAYCGGDLIYANTDGFIVSNPDRRMRHSRQLGEFKIEFEGTAYTYQDKNYWCYQTGDEITGSVRTSVRDQINLAIGEVVHYDINRATQENGVIVQQISNITRESIDVYKES